MEDDKATLQGGVRDIKRPNHWRTLNDKFSLLGKPKKILVLPGNKAISPKQTNGMCKVTEEMLSSPGEKYELCGFFYSDSSWTPRSVIERADQLLDYFIPLIATQKNDGELGRLPMNEAAENMRNVVVVTHCYGSYLMEAVDKKLDEVMKEIGYTDKEIEYIHRQLFIMHQNTPVETLGVNQPKSTNLYRITRADEVNRIEKYSLNSFPYYLLTEDMAKEEVLLSSLSPSQQALIVAQISDKGESEHCGAYWAEAHLKTEAGRQEEVLARAILKEAVFSDYPIMNAEQIIQKTMQKNPELVSQLQKAKEYGQELADDYHDYVEDISSEYRHAKDKLLSHQLAEQDIEDLSVEALFLTDDKALNLFEYAIKNEDFSSAGILWKNMKKNMPKVQSNEDIKTSYKDESYDFLEALMVHHYYAQRALNTDNIELFKAIVQPDDVGVLDISQSKGKTAELAKNMNSLKKLSQKEQLDPNDALHLYMKSRKEYL